MWHHRFVGQGIFVSYRRDDSLSATGRLCDHLRASGFSADGDVFLDIDNIPPGADFRVVIQRTLERCDLVLVVIGKSWLGATDGKGQRRLDSTSDTHRLEVAAALRSDSVVVPLLVEGAAHPAVEDLPEDISELAFRNSWELSERRFADDVAGLARHLRVLRAQVDASRQAALASAWDRAQADRRRADAAASAQAAAEREHREALERSRLESDARLRRDSSQADLYESLQRTVPSASPRRRRWTTFTLLYWIPLFSLAGAIGEVATWNTGTPKQNAGRHAGGITFFVIMSVSMIVGVYSWRRANRTWPWPPPVPGRGRSVASQRD